MPKDAVKLQQAAKLRIALFLTNAVDRDVVRHCQTPSHHGDNNHPVALGGQGIDPIRGKTEDGIIGVGLKVEDQEIQDVRLSDIAPKANRLKFFLIDRSIGASTKR